MSDLEEEAQEFAHLLSSTIRLVCPDALPLAIQIRKRKSRTLATIEPENGSAYPITISGAHLLDLTVSYECSISDNHSYLRVEESGIGVRPHDGSGEHLMRFEYLHSPNSPVPSSHLHIHAHRDAWTFMMAHDGVGSDRRDVKRRGSNTKVPQLSDVHFPLGGPRMRPTLEDVVELLIHELGVDHAEDALTRLATSRAVWRERQMRSLVMSLPLVAAETLRESGWSVPPPGDLGNHESRPDWLTRY